MSNVIVRLYTRPDCDLCAQVKTWLEELQAAYPHTLEQMDIETEPALAARYGERVPVLEVGPYTLEAPLDRARLEITLAAEHQRLTDIARTDESAYQARLRNRNRITRGNRVAYWFSRHYMLVFNLFMALYVGLPFLAPVLLQAGWTRPARWIYTAYGAACHQLAFRSWFLYGEQPAYPRQAAHVDEWIPYEQAINPDGEDLLAARAYTGEPGIGYKVAFCERDVAIYAAILLFGLLFAASGRRIPALPWYLWLLIGIAPIGLDGFSQLISQLPFDAIHRILPYRESTPLLRTLTGFLFGFATAWFGYPLVEDAMRDTRSLLESKFRRMTHADGGRLAADD
ncbi:MAG: hypothetical protein Fur0018_01970 [Anaerolineales bacterium]